MGNTHQLSILSLPPVSEEAPVGLHTEGENVNSSLGNANVNLTIWPSKLVSKLVFYRIPFVEQHKLYNSWFLELQPAAAKKGNIHKHKHTSVIQ